MVGGAPGETEGARLQVSPAIWSDEKNKVFGNITFLRRREYFLFGCGYLENIVYHFFRQLWLVLGVKLMEMNSNWFSR